MTHCKLAPALALFLAALIWGSSSMAAEPGRHRVAADLLAENSALEPGKTVLVAIRERIEPGWHTYWTNPGNSGEPTSIEWTLPAGFSAGPILWPLPHVIKVGPLAEYGYDDEALLLTEIKVPDRLEGDTITLAAKVSYLVCKDICIPEQAQVESRVAGSTGWRASRPVRFCSANRESPGGSARALARFRNVFREPRQGSASAYGIGG